MPLNLQHWILGNQWFQRQAESIQFEMVAAQFASLAKEQADILPLDWNFLLFCGSILANEVSSAPAREMALRIAQGCLLLEGTSSQERDAAAIILDSLANKRAITLAEKRRLMYPNLSSRLGAKARLDWCRRGLENQVVLSDASAISVNKFQRMMWRALSESDWVSASASTSVGKSYVIEQWVWEMICRNPNATVVYVVPTRALIQQVETDFRELLLERGETRVHVSSVPVASSLKVGGANLFVFTQERLHVFLASSEQVPRVDLLVVDEAHKVGDRQRGILLQDVIERVSSANQTAKIIFASPLIENPEVLLADAPAPRTTAVVPGDEVTVNQNLLWVDQVPGQTQSWVVRLCFPQATRVLGRITLPARPTHVSKRLPFVAYALSGDGEAMGTPSDGREAGTSGGNLIYVDGAADAEKTAHLLYELRGAHADVSSADEIKDLITLVRSTIHDDYALATVLTRGVAFHYGNMPLLVRTEVERLFRIGLISFLVCTSTLIEGVNLPCRNIFVRGPKKGRGIPMNEADFWNLAGRAGRWGYEFQGNVVCVDASNSDVWAGRAPRVRALSRIERATDKILDAPKDLLGLIKNAGPKSSSDELNYMVSYLVAAQFRSGSVRDTPWAKRVRKETVDQLDEVLAQAVANLSVEPRIVAQNPGINPFAMDRLLRYFREREKPVEELLPSAPEAFDSSSSYIAVFDRIQRHLANLFSSDKRIKSMAFLSVDWMRGYPLKRIITERIKREKKNKPDVSVPALIRETMADIEEIVRFQAPKHVSCYMDVLNQYLLEIGRADLAHSTQNINVLMEFGVPAGTQLSLMALGLSRTSALAVAEFIAQHDLDERQVLDWLQVGSWREHEIPRLVAREIEDVLRLHQR